MTKSNNTVEESRKQGSETEVLEESIESSTALNPIIGFNTSDILSSLWRTGLNAVKKPLSVIEHSARYARKLVEINDGQREYLPQKKDRRFNHKAWQNQPAYKFWMQSYLALEESVKDWVPDARMDKMDEQRANFILSIIVGAISPSNLLIGNPAALEKAKETKGLSLVNGMTNFMNDIVQNGGFPSQVDKDQFDVGGNLGTSDGQVVFRNEILELIQYSPITKEVYERPLLIVPPQINKFYVYDLVEEKSFIHYCLSQGLQTFIVSWRNPTKKQRGWDLGDYIAALVEAIDGIISITGQGKINLMGACSGGITSCLLMGYLEAIGKEYINSLAISVCSLSQHEGDSDLSLFVNEDRIEAAKKHSEEKGLMKGSELARIFSWMRPNDLIWNYVVNNYYMGQKPPAFDILYWNNDTTNLPAGLHADYLEIVGKGKLESEDGVELKGQTIKLKESTCDKYIIAGLNDHITPWQACYRANSMLGGDKEFILCNSGHVQTLLCTPDNLKAKYFSNTAIVETPEQWLASATEAKGTWWGNWTKWLHDRSGDTKTAPKEMGNKDYVAITKAPGKYVLEVA